MRAAQICRSAPFALALFLVACSKQDVPPAPTAVEVGIVTLVSGPVTVSTTLTGRTAATMTSDVRPQVDGVIRQRLFEEGSIVLAGQPLYKIDPALFKATRDQEAAQLENAQATLATAQAKADRYRKLSDMEAVSRQSIDDTIAAAREARASVHQYQAALETAQINLDYTSVTAPIGGRIGRSSVTPGALVTASQTTALATIQQLDPIYVDIAQSSEQLLTLRQALAKGSVLPASTSVRLTLSDGTAYAQPGTVEFSEVTVGADSGTVTLRARFPNPDGLLLPGMFVRVEAPQSIVPDAIMAPQQGITRDAKGNGTALVVGADDKVEQRSVTADKAIGDKWLVTAGLKVGDRLIVEGTDKVRAGAAVTPVAVTLGGAH